MTDAELQALIIAQVGDDAAGTLATQVPVLWALYADQPTALRMLLCRRDAISIMLARVRTQVSFRALDGAAVNLSDLAKHLQAMYDQVEGQIAEAQRTGAAPLVAERTATAPITPTLPPDANDPRYRGSPYRNREL